MVPKEETIVLRVSSEDKEELQRAAGRLGKSLTSYLLGVGKKQARTDNKRALSSSFRGVPTFFKALCAEARLGGANGYYVAAHELTRHLHSNVPDELYEEEWLAELDRLVEMILAERDDAVWEWFNHYLPKCMTLIPKRRKDRFLAGVYGFLEEQETLY